jgi:hypothetical protein
MRHGDVLSQLCAPAKGHIIWTPKDCGNGGIRCPERWRGGDKAAVMGALPKSIENCACGGLVDASHLVVAYMTGGWDRPSFP